MSKLASLRLLHFAVLPLPRPLATPRPVDRVNHLTPSQAKVDVHPGCQPRTAAQLAACVQIRANAHLRYHEETYGQLYTEAEEDAALELLMAFPLANVVPGDVLVSFVGVVVHERGGGGGSYPRPVLHAYQ